MRRMLFAIVMAVALALPRGEASAEAALAPAAQSADIEERLGGFVPLDVELTDERGLPVKSGDLMGGEIPTVLVLAYYRCAMLCPMLLDGVTRGLAQSGYRAGQDYRLVTVSIDPRDKPHDAIKRRELATAKLGAADPSGVRFLMGEAPATRAIADAVGFRYAYDRATDQYAHPAVVTVLAPGGRISRYLYGFEPTARDLRLSLVEASQGKVGRIVDRVLLTCYRFDPASRRYGPYIAGFFRIGSLFILATVGTGLVLLWRLERRRARKLGMTSDRARDQGGTTP